MPGCISNLRPVSLADSTMKGGFAASSLSCAGLLEKERSVYTLWSSILRSVPSYKFTSQTLTGAGVSCVCSLGFCLFGKREMLQCRGEGCLHRLPRKSPATQRSWSEVALLRKCLLEEISFPTPAPKGAKPSKQPPSCLSICLSSAFLLLSASWSFFSHLQACPLCLFDNKICHREGGSVSHITTGLQ